MATIQTILNRSLRLLGVIASGETPAAAETADALTALNAMLDSWRNDKLMVYSLQNISVTLVNGQASYTIGTSGSPSTNTTAPVYVESVFVSQSGTDYPLDPITDDQYQAKSSKAITTDIPDEYLFNHTYPNSTITLYPVPTVANVMTVRVWSPYASYASASDTFALPPGYEDAVVYNLAMRLYPEYPTVPVNPVVVDTANKTLASVKRLNSKPKIQVTQLAAMFVSNRTKTDIVAGE